MANYFVVFTDPWFLDALMCLESPSLASEPTAGSAWNQVDAENGVRTRTTWSLPPLPTRGAWSYRKVLHVTEFDLVAAFPSLLVFFIFICSRQDLSAQPRLACDSWQPSYPALPTGMTGMWHQNWLTSPYPESRSLYADITSSDHHFGGLTVGPSLRRCEITCFSLKGLMGDCPGEDN